MKRGDVVTVIAFRGDRLEKRVWSVEGMGVLVCSEEQYVAALSAGSEPLCAGYPIDDVMTYDVGRDVGGGGNHGGQFVDS